MSGFKLKRLGAVMAPEPGNPLEIDGVLNPAVADSASFANSADRFANNLRLTHGREAPVSIPDGKFAARVDFKLPGSHSGQAAPLKLWLSHRDPCTEP
jgi:hypothetical protein